ncbi:MAG: DUF4184 family protein [Promethearchaeota archaeon]
MPSTILSHQAPGLALKVRFPKKFDGTALCFGTIIPDFNFIFDFFFDINFYAFTHSLIGQILWTTPLVILATLVFSRYLSPLFAKIASQKGKIYEPLRYFGIDQWKYLKNKEFSRNLWIIITYSALIGGIFHILLDWLSHRNVYLLYPWIVGTNFDFLLYSIVDYGTITIGLFTVEANLTIYALLWILESIIGLIISLYYLRYIKKKDLLRIWYEELYPK